MISNTHFNECSVIKPTTLHNIQVTARKELQNKQKIATMEEWGSKKQRRLLNVKVFEGGGVYLMVNNPPFCPPFHCLSPCVLENSVIGPRPVLEWIVTLYEKLVCK